MNLTIESANKVIPSMSQESSLDCVALVADRMHAYSMPSPRSVATGTIGASSSDDVMNDQHYFASAPLRRRLDDGKTSRIAPPPVLSQEVFDIVGDSALTSSKTTVSPRRGSLLTPREVRELLKDNSNSLDLYLQDFYNTTEDHDDEMSDAESDIDE